MDEALAPAIDTRQSERHLITQITAGDADLFRPLVERYHKGLLHYLANLLGDADLAEDVAQEAFVTAYRKLGLYDPDFAFSTWLYKIATNISYRQLSKLRPQSTLDEVADRLPDERVADVGETFDRAATAAEIRARVTGLEPNYRQVIALYYWEELSYNEIADILERPVGTIRTWLHRAKEQLRKDLHG